VIVHLIDSIEYVASNCFQHQLSIELSQKNVSLLTMSDLLTKGLPKNCHKIISTLKQRTLFKRLVDVKKVITNTPIIIYDQDPWESYKDDSPYKGAYDLFTKELNVESICVTTKWWADFICSRGISGKFVRMWMLPRYCEAHPEFDNRTISCAFIGTIHPHRQILFDQLKSMNVNVTIKKGGLAYIDYLRELSTIQVFIHSEDSKLIIDNEIVNLDSGLWIKDIEAAARGCFSIRNRGTQSESYIEGIESIMLYDDTKEIPAVLESIQKMDPYIRQHLLDSSVRLIREANNWQETVNTLIDE
jgi:hypothetical protein